MKGIDFLSNWKWVPPLSQRIIFLSFILFIKKFVQITSFWQMRSLFVLLQHIVKFKNLRNSQFSYDFLSTESVVASELSGLIFFDQIFPEFHIVIIRYELLRTFRGIIYSL